MNCTQTAKTGHCAVSFAQSPTCRGYVISSNPPSGLRCTQIPASFLHIVKKYLELAGTRWLPQFAQRLGLNLADAFAGDGEQLAYFLERMLRAIFQTKAHLD